MLEPRGVIFFRSQLHGEIQTSLEQTSVVGRAIISDIVIADASIAASHFQIDVDEFPIVRLKALDADISLGNGDCLVAGSNRVLSNSTDFRAGDVTFRVELHGVVDEPPPTATRRRMMPAMLVVALLGSAVFSTTEGSSLPSHTADIGAVSALPLSVEVEPQVSEPPISLRANLELKRLELEGIILDLTGDGAIHASGALFEAQGPRWADFKKWLDTQSRGGLVLVDAVTTVGKAPSLAIQSAWLGETPYVIDGQGDKLFVGASIENGWMIQSIEPGRVNVRRGRQEMAVRF